MEKMKLRPELFWDVNPENIDFDKNAQYVIERVLDLGHDDEVRWVWNYYDRVFLKNIVNNSRSLRAESKNLWQAVLA